jgi:hypothetical protein
MGCGSSKPISPGAAQISQIQASPINASDADYNSSANIEAELKHQDDAVISISAPAGAAASPAAATDDVAPSPAPKPPTKSGGMLTRRLSLAGGES